MKKFIIFVLLMVIAILLLVIAFHIGRGVRLANQGQGDGQHHIQMVNAENHPEEDVNNKQQLPLSVVKVYLGKRGVSDDLANWHDEDKFAEFIQSCQDKGYKEIQYKLMPDSIERLEKRWSEELKKANMKNYVEAD